MNVKNVNVLKLAKVDTIDPHKLLEESFRI